MLVDPSWECGGRTGCPHDQERGIVSPIDAGVHARVGQQSPPSLSPSKRSDDARPRERRIAWREALAPYTQPSRGLALLDIATSVVPYLALCAAMYWALRVS